MMKIKNDPTTHRKRADLARPASSCDDKRPAKPLNAETRALLVSSFGRAGDQKAGYVPFGRIVKN